MYFPCWYSPRYISLLIFPSTCLSTTVKQHKSEWTYPIFWTSFVDHPFFRRQLSQRYVRQTRNKFAAPAVSFKRIWHNISNVYLPTCDLFGMTDTNICQGGRSKRVSGLSAGTGKLCFFGHLGLVFIWSCFVFCLLLLLYYVICAPVLTERTRVSKNALPRLRLPLPLSHSSLSGKTTVWLLQMNWPISIF